MCYFVNLIIHTTTYYHNDAFNNNSFCCILKGCFVLTFNKCNIALMETDRHFEQCFDSWPLLYNLLKTSNFLCILNRFKKACFKFVAILRLKNPI